MVKLVEILRFELRLTPSKGVVLPLHYISIVMVRGLGIEPSSYALQAYAGITKLAHLAKSFHNHLFQQ